MHVVIHKKNSFIEILDNSWKAIGFFIYIINILPTKEMFYNEYV